MKLVGFSSGTGYLCQRDTLGRMRGLMGERRSGMGDLGWSWSSLIPGEEAAGTILGAVVGTGSALYLANKQKNEAYQQANLAAASALRQQGTLAQQQAAQAVQQAESTKSIAKSVVVSGVVIGGVALAGLAIYLIMRSRK